MYKINMLSRADSVKGQGVGSAYLEQVALVKQELSDQYKVDINSFTMGDITHYHSINPEFFLTIPKAKRKGVAVGYVHFIPETLEDSIKLPKFAKMLFYWYVMRFYKSMDLLVTVNPWFIMKLAEYGINPRRVTYIPNYVSSKQFFPITSHSKTALRKEYGLPENRFTVLGVGQLQMRKGLLDFIEIAKKMPDIQFVWAGGFSFGVITDGYEEIKKIKENPPKNVCFLGIIDREKMNEVYNLADVMFLPSYNELFPMTVLESMNCNVPMLLRDLDLYKNILFDFYLKADDNKDFIDILRKLQLDSNFYDKAVEMSKRGKVFYGRDNVTKMWDRFYKRAIRYKKHKEKNRALRKFC